MILGTSFKCLAAKLLLIFTCCDIVVQVICSSCVTGTSFSGITGVGSSSSSISSPVSSFLNGGRLIGGTGSFLFLITFLCINFQDANSMSLPRQQINKLPGLSKQGSGKKRMSKQNGKKKKKKKKNSVKSAHQAKSTESPETNDDDDEKSNLISLPTIPTPTSSSDNNNRNGISSAFSPQHQNLYDQSSQPNSVLRDNRKKSDRLGQNSNALFISYPGVASASSLASGSSLMGKIFMNENEEDTLRQKILAKIEALDPHLCLPKVLCGYSNRRRHKNYSNFPTITTTTTTPRPILAESLIDEYMKLLKILRPGISGEEEQQDNNLKKNPKKKKNNKKKKKRKKAKKKKVEESEEESEESEESNESRKVVTKTKYKSKKSSLESGEDEENDDNGEDEEEEYDDGGEEDLLEFDDEHVKHVKSRARMEKLMEKSGEYSDENWWTELDDNNLKMPFSFDELTKPTSTGQSGGGWLSSMVNMFSPIISWGLGGRKDDGDDFKDDPFFLQSRSLKGGESRSLKSNGILPTFPFSRRGRTLDLEQLFGILDSDKVDYTKEKDPWANKFRVAVELGRRVSSPNQCDFIYNGCPLSYEEILAIINEPLKQATTTTTTTPLPSTRNMSYAQHYITLPPPIIMQLPMQHQYQYHQQQQFLLRPHQQSHYHQPVHHQQMQYHHPVHHQQPQYHQQPVQNQQVQHQPQQQHHAQPQNEQTQQHQPSKSQNFNDIYAQVLKKPQKASIKQSSPSGEEFHINLLYDSMQNSGLAEKPKTTTTMRTTTAEASVEEDDENSSSSGSSSAGNDDPLSYKVLKYHNNNFFQRQNVYSIRRRNDENQKPIIMKNVVPVSTTGSVASNSGSNSAEESMELNPVSPEKSIATDNMIRQQLQPSTVPFTKAEGKYKYRQMLKGTTPVPPRRQSSKLKLRQQQKRKKEMEDIRKKSKRKKKKTKTPYGNSITRFSNHSKKRKAERFKHHHRLPPKRKHRTHLHKQSSTIIGAKNRRKIPGSNARHPVYGHRQPFPSSYGAHYHKEHKPQSYLPSNFFNYIFGKPYI
ncbi:unnamed protein product [Orchesella dallaii]|uniref:Uncharacterized protein n=1 Tax=Orchesella dallaii TaxID=48710 RepID=A0ABP1R710_9HEXA